MENHKFYFMMSAVLIAIMLGFFSSCSSTIYVKDCVNMSDSLWKCDKI